MPYELTKDDLDCEAEWNPAPVRAAGNPNPAVLEALMNYYREGLSHWNKMSADERKLLEHYSPNNNVNILLDAGADINGISAEDLSDYSARFLRGRDDDIDISSFGSVPFRAQLLATAKAKGVEYQAAPLTPVELVREMEGGEDVWENATNQWGFTPKQLAEEKVVDNCRHA
ncbi:hypothetical protein COH20_004272 [Aspergillus flavus]|nr:hypothetical protein NYO67_8224 [Aspergillus flavus]RAQ57778.1 hypothetical protein COH20_004272 [Aspergillus flavus]RAQ64904.1 hypothetical protein COH21_005606 [Aspergillus flavus]